MNKKKTTLTCEGAAEGSEMGACKTCKKGQKKESVRRTKTPVPLRIEVWVREFGDRFFGRCPLCSRTEINALSFECGHQVAHSRGGELVITNLRPICSTCNKSMYISTWQHFESRCFDFIPKQTCPLPPPSYEESSESSKQKEKKDSDDMCHLCPSKDDSNPSKDDSVVASSPFWPEFEFLSEVLMYGYVTIGESSFPWPKTLEELNDYFYKWRFQKKIKGKYRIYSLVRRVFGMMGRTYLLPSLDVANQKLSQFVACKE
jgi:hypothetical protein